MQKTALVLPARGIGDALLMMIASESLRQSGFQVTTAHPALVELQDWFPQHTFIRELPRSFEAWDLIIVENDNSSKIESLKQQVKNLSIFYPSYSLKKHGPLTSLDQCFDEKIPFAENMAIAIARLLQKEAPSKDNGIQALSGLILRRFSQRILLHPMSSCVQKNWSKKKYLALAQELQKKGYTPVFIVSPQERDTWQTAQRLGFPLPEFSTLSALAHFTYESGALIGNDSLMGHLASNFGLPTLTIADEPKRMRLWRPGWTMGTVVTPPSWIPNFKPIRLRKNHWQWFISKRRILENFLKLDL